MDSDSNPADPYSRADPEALRVVAANAYPQVDAVEPPWASMHEPPRSFLLQCLSALGLVLGVTSVHPVYVDPAGVFHMYSQCYLTLIGLFAD